jgi:peptide/nickel transport system permease protein
MIKFAVRRLLLALCVALAVSVVAFALLRMSGDLASALAGQEATAEKIQQIRVQYGLDRPLYEQYFEWLWNAVRGDLGSSLFYRESVWTLVLQHLPVTFKLSIFGLITALVVAIPLGVLSATYPKSWIDRFSLGVSVIGQALPNFWFALMMMVVFSVTLRWLPVSGAGTWKHFVLPSIVLGYYQMPSILRVTRAGMLDVLESDYIRTAWAKGLRPRTVLFKHALRNAVVPVVALTAVNFGHMLSGSVIIETVFALPGIGFLAYESIFRVDFPVVQALLLIVSMFYLVMVVISDLANAWLDPRIRVS